MLELLEQMFRQVRGYMHSERLNRNLVYFQSPDHTTMQFDREAEDLIITNLKESGHGFEIITEERPVLTTTSAPAYRIVIDPVDGSTNVQRGIMTATVALAVLPIEAPVLPENVLWSLVGDLFTGTVYQAQKKNGVFLNGRRCQVSQTEQLHEAIAGLNLDGRDIYAIHRLVSEEPPLAGVRRTGSAAMDVAYVASGAYDAYIDAGRMLTGESFLASAAIVLEAGGLISDQQGLPLRPITTLQETYSLVVSATPSLHQQILERIRIEKM